MVSNSTSIYNKRKDKETTSMKIKKYVQLLILSIILSISLGSTYDFKTPTITSLSEDDDSFFDYSKHHMN